MDEKSRNRYACAMIFFVMLVILNPANASTCKVMATVTSDNFRSIVGSGHFNSRYPVRKYGAWETPTSIGYKFKSPKTIHQYSIDDYSNEMQSLKKIKLQGSNGGRWVTLDVRRKKVEGQSFPKKSYFIKKPGTYLKYRLHVIDDNNHHSGTAAIPIDKLTLKSCACDFGVEQVPALYGDSESVSTSGVFNSAYPAWQAFDNSLSSMWISELWETPAWISYEWLTPRFIDQYTIRYSNGSIKTRAPKDWQLQGWNGSTWVTVDSRHNQVNWSGSEVRSYTVTSPGFYTKIRLLIHDDNDNRSDIVVISIGNLSLRGCE